MLRVLAITNFYPPHHYGGYEQNLADTVAAFRRAGHEVAVLASTVRVPNVVDEEDPSVRRLLRMYWDDHVLLSPSPFERLRIEKANHRSVLDALDWHRPDVVSVWNVGGMSLGPLRTIASRGIPLVYVVEDEWPIYGPKLDAWTRAWARRPRTARVVARITGVPTDPGDLGATGPFCFISESTERHCREGSPFHFDMSAVVHAGISTVDFPLMPPDEKPWQWRLAYVGRIDDRKGIRFAVAALTALPAQATLRVHGIGDDRHRHELEQLARDLSVDDRITWSSSGRSEVATVYRDADVVLFPVTWHEPFGFVPLEAMACATPVIATGTGGSGEFLFDEWNCLLSEPGDSAALADAVRRLAVDADLRQRLVRAGLATAAALTVDRMTETLEQWHLAAARRFRDGRPSDPPPLAERLRTLL